MTDTTPAHFADNLRRAMARNGVRVVDLARTLKVTESTIVDWRKGIRYPALSSAQALADALSAPSLAEMVVAGRTLVCDFCGRAYLVANNGGRPRRWCSVGCQQAGNLRERGLESPALWGKTHKKWRDRARTAEDAIAAFCRSCEWDGICKTPACELRALSPLPLDKEAVA